jgi:hypothetical protein
MTEPAFFVVNRRAGIERGAVVYDRLPPAKADFTRVWAIRMDALPPDYRLVFNPERPIADMMASFARLRDMDQLPPPNLAPPPSPSAGRQGRQLGDWWTPPPVPWDQGAPAEPDYSGLAQQETGP